MFKNQKSTFRGRNGVSSFKITKPFKTPTSEPKDNADSNFDEVEKYSTRKFRVLYRKRSNKKHKTWDNDGFLIAKSNLMTLENDNHKILARSKSRLPDSEGIILVEPYEVEIDQEIDAIVKGGINEAKIEEKENENIEGKENRTTQSRASTTENSLRRNGFKKPRSLSSQNHFEMNKVSVGDHSVVIDPALDEKLRKHQKEGVNFLFNCVTGAQGKNISGAILADEMGLGKTLTTITLIWTLLKRTKFLNESSRYNKVLIVAPVTLVANWKREFMKWPCVKNLGVLAIGTALKSNEISSLKTLQNTNVYQVVIIGYEKLVTIASQLATTKFDLLVCDEGHRLKSGSTKALKVLNDLQIRSKILLSGTPIQNDLDEFYSLINFVNPGILGSYQEFQQKFIVPISRSREKNCFNSEILDLGRGKTVELIELTKSFMLRRTKEVLLNVLPSQNDIIVFVEPTEAQTKMMENLSASKALDSVLDSHSHSDTLALINTFKKLCNSPVLMKDDTLYSRLVGNKTEFSKCASGKLTILRSLVREIYSRTSEKIVLASNYTKTLDLVQEILEEDGFSYSRLDGSVASKTRNTIVNHFNRSSKNDCFALILSSKAGGVGLSLVGASRLVLIDNDWNPAIDLQTMARIQRDGQNRTTYVYRLVTKGTIDEKIFQRQLQKLRLSDKFLDGKDGSNDNIFDVEDLKELFVVDRSTKSSTHDLIGCKCVGDGKITESNECDEEKITSMTGWVSANVVRSAQEESRKAIRYGLDGFQHVDPANVLDGSLKTCGDGILDSLIRKEGSISYMFCKMMKSETVMCDEIK